MSIEARITAIHAAGLAIHNLFERPDGAGWQANVRGVANQFFYEYAVGPSPEIALQWALEAAFERAKAENKPLNVSETFPNVNKRKARTHKKVDGPLTEPPASESDVEAEHTRNTEPRPIYADVEDLL